MNQGVVDHVILVDDASPDETAAIAKTLDDTTVFTHEKNTGYGGNQKSCYRLALEKGADIVIMVHPDYQYTPLLIPAMAGMIGSGLYQCVLGSRILGGQALAGGMPLWKYVANRFLTLAENIALGAKLSEYHSGYRAFSRELLEGLTLEENSDDFVFDNQMLAQVLWHGYTIAEISCPTKYFAEASSINLRRSIPTKSVSRIFSRRASMSSSRIISTTTKSGSGPFKGYSTVRIRVSCWKWAAAFRR
jgi:glycosyltransferase involved in cell wall biosynthesis